MKVRHFLKICYSESNNKFSFKKSFKVFCTLLNKEGISGLQLNQCFVYLKIKIINIICTRRRAKSFTSSSFHPLLLNISIIYESTSSTNTTS